MTLWSVLAKAGGPVALVYGSSIGCLLVGEVLLGRNVSAAQFGQYNLVRQCLPFVVALALLGYDQALTRETAARGGRPARLDAHQGMLVLLAAGTGSLAAAYLTIRLHVFWATALTLVLAGMAVAVTSLVSGTMRASGRPALGALSQQGYRLFSGLAFVFTAGVLTGFLASAVLAAAAVVVAAGCLGWSRRLTSSWQVMAQDHRLMRRLGIGYSLSMLSLALGDWCDSALIGELSGSLVVVGHYGQAKLIALYPLLSLGSILGFVALPLIAGRRESLTLSLIRRWLIVAGISATALGAVMVPLVRRSLQALFGLTPSWHLIILLTCVGALRLYYVLPSAILGATASARRLVGFGLLGVLGVVIQAGVTILVFRSDVVTAAAVGLLTATCVRALSSTALCLRPAATARVEVTP